MLSRISPYYSSADDGTNGAINTAVYHYGDATALNAQLGVGRK
ncbi:hypothetical protein ACGFZK_29505 [Streptomyces sp. NPDC048257]